MTETVIGVSGMVCGMCESHINDVIRTNFQVKKVKSSHKKEQAVVVSEQPLEEQKLREAIASTGYEVTSVESRPYVKRGFF